MLPKVRHWAYYFARLNAANEQQVTLYGASLNWNRSSADRAHFTGVDTEIILHLCPFVSLDRSAHLSFLL